MNAQEIFDTVTVHLFTQGKRATENETCMYRTPEGLKCAVGVLIPDDLYHPSMDKASGNGTAIQELVRWNQFKFPEWFIDNLCLLSQLQYVHDTKSNWDSTENMREELKGVAVNFELNDAIVNQFCFADSEDYT